jgi:hypothetical protein
LTISPTLLNLPVGVMHTFKNESDRPDRMLVWVAPSGLEKMFWEIGLIVPDRSALPHPVTQADIEWLLAAAPRYGIEIMLPS